jgi:hypothetical protein
MIRTLSDGEKISQPGLYRIPLSQHHNQPCEGFSVTSGVLRTMELQTPYDVWAFHKLNPYRFEKRETDALRLGVAMALYVEGGPMRVLEGFNVHDEDKPRKPTKAQIANYERGTATDAAIASVEYWQRVEAEEGHWLTKEEFEEICVMGAVLEQDVGASAVLKGLPEVTLAWQDERTGIWVLSRPDVISLSTSVIDYKRMAARGNPFNAALVDRNIDKGGYDMQIALGDEGLERLFGERASVTGIVAQCSEPPHHPILRYIDPEELVIARFRNRRALDRIAECLKSNHWPGPGEHVGAYHRRKEDRERLLEEMNTAFQAP